MTTEAIRNEIIRNRLLAVTEEMRHALQAVSGSPTVTEASDFFTGLYLPGGEFATMGFQVAHEAPPVGALIRHINRHRATPHAEDMFIGNDPYVGALHQNDVQMAGPIYDGDRLVAWAGVMAHETDVGGMSFASWCPDATEVFQEGLRIPAVKLVDRGEVRDDVLEMIVTASRLPAALELDIRAFIATINVARARMQHLFDRYGAATVTTVMRRMIDSTEHEVRERLKALPDGTVHVQDFLEHDGHENRLYTIDLRATKRSDELILDFSGSSPQAPGFINATRAGLHGGVAGALIPTIAFGIPWNEGVLRPVTILAPDGLICTAQHPAPVGSATVETIWTVTNTVQRVVNTLFACSDEFADRAQAVSAGTMATFNMGGVNQFGERFGLHLLDPLAAGFGAFATKDGVDAGGPCAVPVPSIADVERNEQVSPLFYAYRRLRPDTAGAGTRRGGTSGEMALTIRGIPEAHALVMTHGAEVPNSVGLFGGLPGATVTHRLISGTAPETGPRELDDREWQQLGPKPGEFAMHPGDFFAASWQGGGGWGDPISRAPQAVRDDVDRGVISAERAHDVFGVVLADQDVDLAATDRRRREIRHERLGYTPTADPSAEAPGRALGPELRVRERDGVVEIVTTAGAVLSTGTTQWRSGAVSRPVAARAPHITLHEDLEMTAQYCPASGALLAIDVHRKGTAPLEDLLLDAAGLTGQRRQPTP
jgi:N-methylhydantoinase B